MLAPFRNPVNTAPRKCRAGLAPSRVTNMEISLKLGGITGGCVSNLGAACPTCELSRCWRRILGGANRIVISDETVRACSRICSYPATACTAQPVTAYSHRSPRFGQLNLVGRRYVTSPSPFERTSGHVMAQSFRFATLQIHNGSG